MTPTEFFFRFRQALPAADQIHAEMIGHDARITTLFGEKPLIYADFIASGRALMPVETSILRDVLPFYANAHTEASHCGGFMTRLRREARAELLRMTGGSSRHAVIFTGAGATSAINRVVRLWQVGPDTTVLLGPYEHHSNILPWRESGARVVMLPEDATYGGPCRAALATELAQSEGPVVAAFSAASNVTGIIADVAALTAQVKAAGARMLWDYAGAGPYMPLDLGQGMDAVVLSPHKFIGGPGGSGLLLIDRETVRLSCPTQPGGGTVRFVDGHSHDYATQIEAREEAGTPNVVGDLRAALAMVVKDQIGAAHIMQRGDARWRAARDRLSANPRIRLLGRLDLPRLPILSFTLHDDDGVAIHQQLVTRLLSDLHGVQARGGCACAGPYVLSLMGFDAAATAAARQAILSGDEMAKPGFTRLSLCWAAPDCEIEAILTAIEDVAARAPELAARYRCDPQRAIFHPCTS